MIEAKVVRQLLVYEQETGLFRWKMPRPHRGRDTRCGYARPGRYVDIKIGKKSYRAHRLAWLYMTGEWPRGEIDHIDGDRHNNSWSNLRDVAHQTNTENRRRSRGASGLIGAHKVNGWFISSIMVRGRVIRLGRFNTAQEAHDIYVSTKRLVHAGCTI